MPLSDVALPPAGIRCIWLGSADGAGVSALGDAVEGAGCARTGARIARAATAATLIKRCFICSLFLWVAPSTDGRLSTLTINREGRNEIGYALSLPVMT
jgi:hypothetical protein